MGNLEQRKTGLTESKVNPPAKGPEALSNKPSELIRQSMEDLRRAELSPLHAVNMEVWHEPGGNCVVCQAGSVMAGTLQLDPNESAKPSSRFHDRFRTQRKLFALNYFRLGNVLNGLAQLVQLDSVNRHGLYPNLARALTRATQGRGWVYYPDMRPDISITEKEELMKSKDWQRRRKAYEKQMQRLADELEKLGF